MLNFGYYNMDCMIGMAQFPDKFFDLAIVDPPYGIGEADGRCRTRKKHNHIVIHKKKEWDKKRPDENYFNELYRISKNQIIWGANYFVEYLKPSMGWIYWDKFIGGDFSDGELAYTSFQRALKKFSYSYHAETKGGHLRIHPTQKPIALYRWPLQNYAKPGDKILDTHVGSASSLIACEIEGFNDYVGFELDEDYYKDSLKRLEQWRKSRTMEIFEPQEIKQVEQSKLMLF